MADAVLFTIGYSTHPWPHLLELLQRQGVTAIADVRSQPVSRLPQYNKAELQPALIGVGIEYAFLGRELGARREERECYENGQAIYEKIAELPAFREGLERILRGLDRHRIALMCAEKEPLDCHRTVLVCQHLRGHQINIRHILADGETEDHSATERRLLQMTATSRNLFESDLTEDDLLNRAYETRGRQIAYRMTSEGATP
jgi:uncharacterized protein (DUF488 family)